VAQATEATEPELRQRSSSYRSQSLPVGLTKSTSILLA